MRQILFLVIRYASTSMDAVAVEAGWPKADTTHRQGAVLGDCFPVTFRAARGYMPVETHILLHVPQVIARSVNLHRLMMTSEESGSEIGVAIFRGRADANGRICRVCSVDRQPSGALRIAKYRGLSVGTAIFCLARCEGL